MKVTQIIAESTKKPVSEAPVNFLKQYGKKVIAKTAAKVGAKNFAAGVAGNVDTGAEANELRKNWQAHQGSIGGSMKANDPKEFKNWLMNNGFKDKGPIIDKAIADAAGAGEGAIEPGSVVKSKSGQDVLAGIDGKPTMIKPNDEKGKAEIVALAKKKGIKTAGGKKYDGGPFNKKVLDKALLQIVQDSKKAAPQDGEEQPKQDDKTQQQGQQQGQQPGKTTPAPAPAPGPKGPTATELDADIKRQLDQATKGEKDYALKKLGSGTKPPAPKPSAEVPGKKPAPAPKGAETPQKQPAPVTKTVTSKAAQQQQGTKPSYPTGTPDKPAKAPAVQGAD
jgi:hypothetical protein